MPDIFVGESENHETNINESVQDKAGIKEVSSVKPSPINHKSNHRHSHLLSAYCDNPQAVKVADKLDDEEILLYLRKHFVTNIPWIIKAISFMLVFPLFIFVNLFGLIDITFIPYNYVLFISIFYYMMIFTYMFVHYLSWFYNISLVTTKRIIDIDFSSLVYENVAATKLTQLEDVSYSQIGIIRSIFDYGDVTLQTAGTVSGFDFLAVPHPEKVINVINNLIGKSKHA